MMCIHIKYLQILTNNFLTEKAYRISNGIFFSFKRIYVLTPLARRLPWIVRSALLGPDGEHTSWHLVLFYFKTLIPCFDNPDEFVPFLVTGVRGWHDSEDKGAVS